jgi:type I restriction-modification system DNA methylase subunit
MFRIINEDEYKLNILINQTKSWWGKNIDIRTISLFVNIYKRYMIEDKETMRIIRTVKELYIKNIRNNRESPKIIETYLIPQDLEKKKNAEVSTPYKLRREMLDKMPINFWTKIRRVYEPCAGKGGFLLDIIEMFMEGLKKKYPEENKRYNVIVSKCLYFSDINPTNIFICKLLLDPYGEYNLNFNEGNTLELDITEKWGIDGFDAVIGNPPYNASGAIGTGHTIWQDFTYKALREWLYPDGFLCYVHHQDGEELIIINTRRIKEKFY